MLTNVLRLLGAIKNKKESLKILTRPAHIVLPLSPNHGIFGHDGLYSESQLGLEALLNRWSSEGWRDYLSVVGAVIGWTRGTGLMNSNDIVACGIEEAGMQVLAWMPCPAICMPDECFFPLDCHPGAAAELIDLQTFSQFEMCFNLIGLLHPDMVGLAQTTAMVADLSGNMRSIPNLNDHLNKLRADLLQQAAAKKAVIRDDQLDKEVRRCVLVHLLPPT